MKQDIPQQTEGKKLDLHESREFSTTKEAEVFYAIVKNRLLNINSWYHLAELPSASFQHLDHHGHKVLEIPVEGDYIRIDIPGPGLSSTGGYDYVQIEQIEEENEENHDIIKLTLRPSTLPDEENDEETKHFFKNMATSTFHVERIGNSVQAHYYGRNELLNMDVHTLADKIRNLFVGLTAKLGASNPQWKALLKGLLRDAI